MRVLLVEDDYAISQSIETMLKKEGMVVDTTDEVFSFVVVLELEQAQSIAVLSARIPIFLNILIDQPPL